MPFFGQGREGAAISRPASSSMRAVLASPEFLYRVDAPRPAISSPARSIALSDLELASRLSFFLWSDCPDDELLKVAESGKLTQPRGLRSAGQRMLADKRAAALVTSFAMRWLNVDDLDAVEPDPRTVPGLQRSAAARLLHRDRAVPVDVLLENRSVLELLSADYTFLNERLAQHYGITRRARRRSSAACSCKDPNRFGPAGQGRGAAAHFLRRPHFAGAARRVGARRSCWARRPLRRRPVSTTNLDTQGRREADHAARPAGRAPRDHDLQRVPWRDRPDRPCHGELRRDRRVAHATGHRRCRWMRAPCCRTACPSTGRVGLREALLARPDQFVQTITEKLLMYALGREVEAADMPQVRAIVRDGRPGRLPLLRPGDGRREKRCIPPARRRRTTASRRPGRRAATAAQARQFSRRNAHVHHQEAPVPPHLLKGAGRLRGAAAAGRDDSGGHRAGRHGRGAEAARGFFYIPHGAIMDNTPLGKEVDAWTPSGEGADFTLNKIMKPLDKYKQQLISFGNLENGAARFGAHAEPRDLAVGVRAGRSEPGAHMAHHAGPGDRGAASARTPRCRR